MSDVLYHKHFAWNLVEDAIESNILQSPHPDTYWGRRRAEGIHEEWLSPQRRRASRELLVLFDRVLLPGELDVPLESLRDDGHVDWSRSAFPRFQNRPAAMYAPEAVAELRPFIQKSLSARGLVLSDTRFEQLIELWKKVPDWETKWLPSLSTTPGWMGELNQRWVAEGKRWDWGDVERTMSEMGNEHPEHRNGDFWQITEAVSREFSFLEECASVAAKNIPTFGEGADLPGYEESRFQNLTTETPVIIAYYFSNVVRCPSPRNLREELDLKNHDSVIRWREKVFAWSHCLATGSLRWEDIRGEIADANGYLEGAHFLSNLVPSWSIHVTLPLGIAAHLVPHLAPVGWALIGVEAVKAYGELVGKAVSLPDRLQYKWLMVSE